VCLCTVIDVFTWEVLGFNVSRAPDAASIRVSSEGAIPKTGTVPICFHSDQESEYAEEEIFAWLTKQGVPISMNPKGSSWCNGSQESFFGRFKVEFGDFGRFDTYVDLLEELYAQLYYFARVSIRTRLKMAPAKLRLAWEEQQSK